MVPYSLLLIGIYKLLTKPHATFLFVNLSLHDLHKHTDSCNVVIVIPEVLQ